MKLLGWMHRNKLRQNDNQTPKDFSIGFTGQPCLDNPQCYQKGSYGYNPFGKAQRDNYLRNSFTGPEQIEEEPQESADIFHGFLTIGTLGTESIPGTPTFSISVDHMISEIEAEATDDELKVINDELEKVLGDDTCSNVSSGRDSHVSTITLSGKTTIESDETTCPLQSYLFGSPATGLPAVRREHHRISLGELFQKTKQAEEYCGTKCENGLRRETEKSAVNVMKKMIKRRKNSATTSIDSTKAGKKLQKILHIFNRKVHPENSNSCHEPTKNETGNNDNTHLVKLPNSGGGLRPSTEDIIVHPQQETTGSCKNESHIPQLSGETTGNEFWVKTDADYLVLEL